ncbi:hypothetical protein V8D89_007709 [Ganoderma adspersum]
MKLRTSVCVCVRGGMRLTLCVVFPMLSPCFLLSHFTSHTHSHSLSVIRVCRSVGRARARLRPGHGAAAGVVMFPCSFLMSLPHSLCCCSTTHSPHLPPPYVHVSKTVCIGHGYPTPPAADLPTFDPCTALSLPSALPYSMSIMHMHICHIRPAFTYGSCTLLLPFPLRPLRPFTCLLILLCASGFARA